MMMTMTMTVMMMFLVVAVVVVMLLIMMIVVMMVMTTTAMLFLCVREVLCNCYNISAADRGLKGRAGAITAATTLSRPPPV